MIKSVHLTNYYHKNSGGISTSYNNLLKAAARHRREIRLIVPGETEQVEQVNDYARIYYVPAKYSPVFDKRYRIILPWQYMPDETLIRNIMIAERPDLVEVTDKYTLSMMGAMVRIGKFSQIGRPPLVHFSCERMDDNIASFMTKGRLGRRLARSVIGKYILPSFDFHIANSPYTAEEFFLADEETAGFLKKWARKKLRAPQVDLKERVFVCPRGVNAEMFSPDRRSPEVRKQMRGLAAVPDEAVLLLYAGRISPEKNIPLLVDFMKILALDKKHDYRLLVAGAGPREEWLRQQIKDELEGKIVLLGHLDKELLADFYANADVFVHPNPKEPFGIAPLEAMASGVPVVAPDSGGILSYATDENIWMRKPTGEQFAAAIREIVDNPEKTARKIDRALETARRNTWEASTDRLLATYDKIYEDFQRRRNLFTGE